MKRSTAIVLLALILGSFAFWIWRLPPRAATPARNGQKPEEAELMKRFIEIESREKQLDQTVWANERLAEQHETFFIRLWDSLRQETNRFGVLRRFPAGEIKLGAQGPSTGIAHQIQISSLAPPLHSFSGKEWETFLSEMEVAGYRLEQSEWRHAKFIPATANAPARSVIAMTLHLRNDAKTEREIVRGNLEVEWESGPEFPVPRQVMAPRLEILTQPGEPAFRQVMAKTFAPQEYKIFIDPLILYDLDGDGRSEIILACKNTVYWNQGKGVFRAAPLCLNPAPDVNTGVIADFNGDGIADFLAADLEGLLLYPGTAEGKFPTAPLRSWSSPDGLQNPFVLTCGDIDGDGDLDIWMAQYKLPHRAGQMATPIYDANDGFPAFLLVNDGHGVFADKTAEAGLAKKRFRRTYSSSFVDLNEDGKFDLVVVSDFAGVDLYYNDGKGHFTDATASLGESHAFGMAHTIGDYNLDGKLDLFVVGMNSFTAQRLDGLKAGPPERSDYQNMRPALAFGNRLYFRSEQGFNTGPMSESVARTGWSWGASTVDFDNDGAPDLYVVNGHISRASARDYETQFWLHDIYVGKSAPDPAVDLYYRSVSRKLYGEESSYGGYEKNRLFLNQGGKSFLEIGHLAGLASELDCRNVVADDLDGDGRMDLILTTYAVWPYTELGVQIFQNQMPDAGNWIAFSLREGGPGYSPVGAKVILSSASGKQVQQLVTGDSYRSQQAPVAHFGLGKGTRVEFVEIRWPNGKVERMQNPAINRLHQVRAAR